MHKVLLIIFGAFSFIQSFAQTVCTREVANFVNSGNYSIDGSATLTDSAGILTLTLSDDFMTDQGPDLYLYLSINNQPPTTSGNTNYQVAQLLSSTGGQSYTVGGSTEIDDYDYVTIHCVDFNAFWGGGALGATSCVFPTTSDSITEIVCDSLISPSGDFVWYESGTYIDTLFGENSEGGDSVVTITLNIDSVDVSTTENALTIMANATEVSYQWLDCDNNYMPMMGDSLQSFTATADGNYAVEITTANGCVDTSACTTISTIGLTEWEWNSSLQIFPNPTKGLVYLETEESDINDIRLYNTLGQLILEVRDIQQNSYQFEMSSNPGVYLMEIQTSTGTERRKLVLE
jgi:hypothetical protein